MCSTAAGMASACAAWPAGTWPSGRNWCRTGRCPMIHRRPDRMDPMRRRLLGSATLAAASFLPLARAAAKGAKASPVIRTDSGRVRGFLDGDLMVFRGIRYGADTGARRFMPPEKPPPWKNVVDTREFGAASMQPGNEANQ